MKVYEAVVCDWEWFPLSLHKTKAGAYKRCRQWLLDQYIEEYDWRLIYGKSTSDFQNVRDYRFDITEKDILE
jgi:hypothetical protein